MSVVSGEVLHRISRDELIHVLESIHGVKDIFLDGSLMKPLDRIAGISVLRDHGVDKVYALSHEAPADPHKHRVYMVRSGVANTRLVCELVSAQINRRSDTDTAQYHVVYVAKVLHACRVLLESEGLHGRLAVHSLPLDFVSVDCDLASLELPDFLRHVFVDGLTWPATAVARATWRLRALLGATRCHVYAVGHVAQQVVDLMSLFDDSGGSVGAGGGGGACEVDHLLVMDRSADWPAVLLTQLTYAGLLHETMPVKCGVVEVPDGSGGSAGGVCKLALHCRDEVYAELRDMHISGALPALSARAKQLQCQHANRRNLSLGDMKEFIQDEMRTKQAQHRSLAAHISLSEAMMSSSSCGTGRRNVDAHHLCVEHSLVRTACVGSDADSVVDLDECRRYVEQWMAVQRSAPTALRLLCLYAAAAAPLSHRRYQQLAAQFVASYGHRHLATLQRLAALGMLTPTSAPTSAAVAAVQRVTQPKAGVALTARRLKLMPSVTSADSVSGVGALLTPPPDPSYVYGGSYVPVCCRLLEAAVGRATSGGGDWSNVQAAFKQLTAAGACSHQCPPAGDETKSSVTVGCPARAVCVLVLGGCTMAEVAAMQATARSLNCRLLTLTTSVITGDSLMHELASLA